MLHELKYYRNPDEYWDVNIIKTMISNCEHNIRETTDILNKAKKRMKELERLKYRYVIQIIYIEPYQSDFYGHGGYYLTCVSKIPILDNVSGDWKRIREVKCNTYENALKEFSKFKNKFKKFKPNLLDNVPQHMKHTLGDL